MMKFIARTEAALKSSESRLQRTEAMLCNKQATIQNLENQIGRFATLFFERPQACLLSNTEVNPKGQVKAIKRVREEEEEEKKEAAKEAKKKGLAEVSKEEKETFGQEDVMKVGTHEEQNEEVEGNDILKEKESRDQGKKKIVHKEGNNEETFGKEGEPKEKINEEGLLRKSRMTKPWHVQHIKVYVKEKRRVTKKKRKLNERSSLELTGHHPTT